jgi:hypothetical protein
MAPERRRMMNVINVVFVVCPRAGVITEQRPVETAATAERGTANGVVPLHQFVSSVWNSLRSTRSLFDVDIEFEPTEYSGDMTMNSLFEGASLSTAIFVNFSIEVFV